MTGFESPNRERFIALFASSISFPDRKESPHVHEVGRTTPSFLKYLYNAMVHTCIASWNVCAHGCMYYIMRENLFGKNLIGQFFTIRQTAKFKFSPNFPAIRYVIVKGKFG